MFYAFSRLYSILSEYETKSKSWKIEIFFNYQVLLTKFTMTQISIIKRERILEKIAKKYWYWQKIKLKYPERWYQFRPGYCV